ncbi:hypothetical protein U14_03952 [Candidatus Moduliflexus flocculans]|uniref:DUF434 domain-containing protein n=1 Tax=Candidatus Moduliflexus flocculans TaxID=1499966 RepID=A0A0S6W362_9BACT|nr:hypothetical protein U14_03952 [Candidatus Moduliflexus flocculans]
MPDTRHHRGAHPADAQLFSESELPALRAAVEEFSWLLSRGYAHLSGLKLVGDRHALNARQRMALSRAACSDQACESRQNKCLPLDALAGQTIIIDGFNLMITLEAAFSGGLLLRCRDGCIRDLASVHGSYRAVAETEQALEFIGMQLHAIQTERVIWLFDQPVSNSGRMAQRIRELASMRSWNWEADTRFNPDAAIAQSPHIAITSDSSILDNVAQWCNVLAAWLALLHSAWLVDLM